MSAKEESSTQSDPTSEPKQSIWTRDFILIALINLAAFLSFNMATTGMPVYVASLGASSFQVGLVTTLATTAALCIRPFTGIMLDRFQRKGMLIVGLITVIITTAAYAVFPLVGVILALRIFHGIGWGLGSSATSTIAADVIPRKRFAEGMGYFALTTAVAVAIAPALAIALVQNSGALPMIIIATIAAAIALVLACFQRSNTIEKVAEKAKLTVADFFDKRALLPAIIMFFANIAFASIITFIALHGEQQGADNIFLYFTVYAVVTILTRPIIGKIIDKIGFFVPGILSMIGVAITLVVIAFSSNIIMFCLAGVFAGLGLGTGMGTFQAMAVASVPPQRRGVATSTYLFGFDAGIAVGAIIAGSIVGMVGYSTMYLIMSIFPFIALLIFLGVGRKRMQIYSYNQ